MTTNDLKRKLGFLAREDLHAVAAVAGVGTCRVVSGKIQSVTPGTVKRRLLAWSDADPSGKNAEDLAEWARLARHGKLIVGPVPAGTEDAKRVVMAEDRVREMIAAAVRDEFEFDWDDAALLEKARAVAAETAQGYRRVEIVVRKPAKPAKRKKWTAPPEYERLLQLASQRVNVLMVGPTGCGKTFLARHMAEDLDLPFSAVSCSVGMSESQLAGWLLPGEGGAFRYKPAPFVERYEGGGVFLFDEFDSADANALTFANAALSNGEMHIAHRSEDGGRVRQHEDFVCVAAANTWGTGADAMYVGRNQLDEATLNRFAVGRVLLDYSADVERSVADPKVCAWGWAIRESIREQGLRRVMSTRTLKDMSTMARSYSWGVEDWERSYFAGWSDDERDRVAPAGRKAVA